MNNVKGFTDAGSASKIYTADLAADLSARLVNRDKDLVATTDAHHRPVRVHAERPGKGLQAKQSKSLRPKTRPYKSQIKTEITCLTVYTITPKH